jgi:N6-adenosine-specific RNA methylase IME4
MSKPPITILSLDKIRLDLSPQARVAPDPAKVEEYAEALRSGDSLPPIDLYRVFVDEALREDYYYLIGDGQTRFKAHQLAGLALINAHIHEGGRAAALRHAVRANTSKQHGVVRTQADARNAVRLYLLEGDWYTHSDREVGRACDIDHKTVATIRTKMVAAKEIPEATERKGGDGKTRQLGNSPVEAPAQAPLFPSKPIEGEPTTEELSASDATSIDKKNPKEKQPAPKCHCGKLAYNGKQCMEHIPKEDTFKPLTKLLGDLADSISDRGWTYQIEIPKQKKPCQVIEACTLVPSVAAKLQRERDDEGGLRLLFYSADLDQHLCTFVARPTPKPLAEKLSYRETVDTNREAKHAAIAGEAKSLASPDKLGPFSVIYCDPPWQYSAQISEAKSIEQQYPTLSITELCALNVAAISAPRAVLYLWVTAPMIKEAMMLLDAWGYQYKSQAVWIKGRNGSGMGHWWRVDHELLFVATRGSFPTSDPELRISSVLEYARGRHSEKPREVREYLDKLYPDQPRVELFARESSPGWVAIGNEIDGRDIREVLNPTKQLGLPLAATPKESAPDNQPEAPEAIPAPTPTEAERHLCEATSCMEIIHKSENFCNKHKPEPRLHDALRETAKAYQQEGYKVTIAGPRGGKQRAVTGALQTLVDRPCYEGPAKRDEQEDAYSIDFLGCYGGSLLCTLHAIRAEAPAEEEATDAVGPWANRALSQLKACTTREEFDQVYTKLEALASTLEERNELLAHREELRAKLPSQFNVRIKELAKDSKPEELTSKKETHRARCHFCELGPYDCTVLKGTKEPRFICAECRKKTLSGKCSKCWTNKKDNRVIDDELQCAACQKVFSHPDQKPIVTEETDELIIMEAWLVEGAELSRKGGYVLFEDEVREVTLTQKAFTSWKNDARIKMRTVDWIEEMTADMKRCNTVGEGTRIFDAMILLCVTTAEKTQVRGIFAEWKSTKPATKPYNAKPSAPKPARKKGRNEEKKPAKKAGRR